MTEVEHAHTTGALKSIEEWGDIPKRLLEAIMEGLAKEPSKWMVMGLGFYLGYRGFDVFKWFIDTIGHIGTDIGDTLKNAALDLAKLPMLPVLNPIAFLSKLFGPMTGPVGPISDESISNSASTAVTAEDIADDNTKGNLDLWAHELELKLIAGAFGALAAITITTPGFFSGLGEIVKGIGEIVPF